MNESYRMGEQSIIAYLQRLANGISTAELDVDALPAGLRAVGEQLQKTHAILQQERQLLERNAYIDPLTNLGNRNGFDRHVEQLWRKGDPFTCAYDLLVSEHCAITMIDFITADSDIGRILRDGHAAVISDSTYPTEGKRHPRVCGTFARIIEKFVENDGVLTLEEAVKKMTSVPAAALGLRGKGRIAPGMDADLCVFDPKAVREGGDYRNPHRYAGGMDYVLVSGVPAIAEGEFAAMDRGSVLRRE